MSYTTSLPWRLHGGSETALLCLLKVDLQTKKDKLILDGDAVPSRQDDLHPLFNASHRRLFLQVLFCSIALEVLSLTTLQGTLF
jgi:hypothetical protein